MMPPIQMQPRQMQVIRKLATGPQTTIDLTPEEVKIVQDLVKRGVARDYSSFTGHRTEVRLRIWGLTSIGKAILEQQTLVDASVRRQQLTLLTNPAPTVKPPTRTTRPPKPKS